MPEALPPLLVFLAVVVAILVAKIPVAGWAWNHELEALKTFARTLDHAQLREPKGPVFLRSLRDVSLTGALAGHGLQVEFDVDGSGEGETRTRFAVEVPNAVSDFTVERAGPLRRLGRKLGVVSDLATGDPAVDAKYVLAGQEGTLRELFADPELEEALDALFQRERVESVALRGGWLRIERTGSRGAEDYQRATRTLLRLARLCERKPVELAGLGGSLRFAATGAAGELRCPFCHDDLDLSDREAVAACPACATVHHAECLAEAGCAVFGCTERRPRGRA